MLAQSASSTGSPGARSSGPAASRVRRLCSIAAASAARIAVPTRPHSRRIVSGPTANPGRSSSSAAASRSSVVVPRRASHPGRPALARCRLPTASVVSTTLHPRWHRPRWYHGRSSVTGPHRVRICRDRSCCGRAGRPHRGHADRPVRTRGASPLVACSTTARTSVGSTRRTRSSTASLCSSSRPARPSSHQPARLSANAIAAATICAGIGRVIVRLLTAAGVFTPGGLSS